MFGNSFIRAPALSLVSLNQNEDIVNADGEHQEGDYFYDNQRRRDADEAEHAHRAYHWCQYDEHTCVIKCCY